MSRIPSSHYRSSDFAACIRVSRAGFTLVELSIVLVIIGLIVGGVLVGRDLISAATVRAQISQIEKYRQAVNTFQGKYGYLPGDIRDPDASNFGFQNRGTRPGQGDGNGMLEGNSSNHPVGNTGTTQVAGETPIFWVDLSKAGLIPETFNTATSNAGNLNNANISGTALNNWFPQAAIGKGYVLVMGGNGGNVGYMNFPMAGPNYFVVEGVNLLGNNFNGTVNMTTNLTVKQAYDIDSKTDDGMPQTGNIMAIQLSTAAGFIHSPAGDPPTYSAMSPNVYSCYDNNNAAGTAPGYSVRTYPNNLRCTLAFKFQ